MCTLIVPTSHSLPLEGPDVLWRNTSQVFRLVLNARLSMGWRQEALVGWCCGGGNGPKVLIESRGVSVSSGGRGRCWRRIKEGSSRMSTGSDRWAMKQSKTHSKVFFFEGQGLGKMP